MDLGIAIDPPGAETRSPEMSIAENIFLGREPTMGPLRLLDRKRNERRGGGALREAGAWISTPRRVMSALSVAQRQMVEIAKAISYDSSIIIMDEPTSAITTKEVDRLFEIIALLKSQGTGVIYISHKMEEIFCVADRVMVLRDGRAIGTRLASETGRAELISMMVGREIADVFPARKSGPGGILLQVEGLGAEGCFDGIGFELRSGEILGIAGAHGRGADRGRPDDFRACASAEREGC